MTTTFIAQAPSAAPPIGQLTGGPFSGSTLDVSTLQGTFPSPTTGQAFVAVVNPNLSGLLDNTTTERVIVTANSSGTWTLSGSLAHSHSAGEYVAIVVDPNWLNNLLQLAGGTMSGAIAMGSNKITGLANGSSAQDAAAFGQIAGNPGVNTQTLTPSVSGSGSLTEYLNGSGLKIYAIKLSAWSDAGQTLTFTTPFTLDNSYLVTEGGGVFFPSHLTLTQVTLPTTAAAAFSCVIIIMGI
jgi:hypothetical protein